MIVNGSLFVAGGERLVKKKLLNLEGKFCLQTQKKDK
jgi:hypothetical protein